MADVPCLRDSSFVGDPGELNGAVFVNLADRIGTFEEVLAVFAGGVESDHDFLTYLVGVVLSFDVFTFVVEIDKLLLAFSDGFPVSFKRDVEESIASENQLRRRCAQGGVDGGVDGATYGGDDSFKTETCV